MKPSIYLILLLSTTILFPVIVGLVRLRRIKRSGYQPFFYLLVLGVVMELLNSFLIKVLHVHNVVAVNIFQLFEWLLIAWQFRVWGLLRNQNVLFNVLLIVPCLVWVVEYLVFGQIWFFAPYFQVLYCFLIVMLSVNSINFMITHDYRNLFGNPTFLICIAFIVYFIYRIVVCWAYQTSLKGPTDTTSFILSLNSYVNALTNVIFGIALIRIPQPQKFTLK